MTPTGVGEDENWASDGSSPTPSSHDGSSTQVATFAPTAASKDKDTMLYTWPPIAYLPVELLERVVHYASSPSHDQVSEVPSREEMFQARVRMHNTLPLCLVSRQFEALARPQLYRVICIPHRRLRSFLRSVKMNPALARNVRSVRLDSHVWTPDVNELTIARFCVAVRRYCLKLRFGANESVMLPYLFHGPTEAEKPGRRAKRPAAVQVLKVCWRDEDDYDPERIRADEQLFEHVMTADTGETSTIGAKETLVALFERAAPPEPPPPPLHAAMPPICMHGNLHHLTLDVLSQTQVDQLFVESGYFVKSILPLLTFLRIELPVTVLQCTTARRGAMAPHWPCKRFTFTDLQQVGQADATHTHRLSDTIADVARRNRKAEITAGEKPGCVVMAPCLDELLRSLLTRFALNVHRNDATLFQLLIGGTASAEQIWSTRTTIAANVLEQSLQRQLRFGSTAIAAPTTQLADARFSGYDRRAMPSSPQDDYVVFAAQMMRRDGVEPYWEERWAKAKREQERCMSTALGGAYRGHSAPYRPDGGGAIDFTAQADIHVSLLLRWPVALEKFFRFSAMI